MHFQSVAGSIAGLVLCGVMWIGQAAAQPQPQPQPPPPQREAADFERPHLIDLDFKGGTAADYVEAVRKAGGDVNIVVLTDLSRVPMPAVRLRHVEPWTAVDLLNSVPRGQADSTGGLMVGRKGDENSDVYTITSRFERASGGAQEVTVVSLQELLGDGMKAQDILTAVQAAVDMLKAEQGEAQLRFHEATGLLIVRGPAQQVQAARSVVGELRERIERKRMQGEMQQSLKALRSQLQTAQEQLEQMKGEIQEAARQAAEARTRAEVMHEEAERARTSLEAKEAEARALRLELEMAKRPAQPK